jgi:phosphohistidine phosphatase SixA
VQSGPVDKEVFVAVVLLRHAKARSNAGYGDDVERTLDATGVHQASNVAQVIARLIGNPKRLVILASPALRCQSTVAPLALCYGMDPTTDDRLGEFASQEELIELVDIIQATHGALVVCGHGPSLLRLSRLITETQGLFLPDDELALGVASFLHLGFGDGSGHPLTSLARHVGPSYDARVLVG